MSPSLLLLLLWHTVAGQIVRPVGHGRRWRSWTDGLWLAPSPARRRRRFVQVKLSRLVHRDAATIHWRRLLDVSHAVRIVRHAVLLLLLLALLRLLRKVVFRHLVIRRR